MGGGGGTDKITRLKRVTTNILVLSTTAPAKNGAGSPPPFPDGLAVSFSTASDGMKMEHSLTVP